MTSVEDPKTEVAEMVDVDDALLDASTEHRSLWSDVWRQFRQHKGAVAGLILLVLICLFTFVGPEVYPHDPFELNTVFEIVESEDADGNVVAENICVSCNAGPSWDHIAGTDNLGRDVLVRVMIGGRVSLAVGFAAMIVALILGTAVGILAGFFRQVDFLLMWITDLFLALPLLPVLLVIVALWRDDLKETLGEERGIFLLVVVVIGATSWMQTARVVRGDVLALKEQEFVLAARSLGTRQYRVLLRHIFPNVLSPVTVAAAIGIANAIITESALSFLGLGFPADFPTWGRLLSEAQAYLELSPWRLIWPGVLITTTVMCVNFIGDGLRDALDPRLRSKG